ncbi:MAG: hypothetical protein ACRDRH_21335 [Pseudonocardia sp.]
MSSAVAAGLLDGQCGAVVVAQDAAGDEDRVAGGRDRLAVSSGVGTAAGMYSVAGAVIPVVCRAAWNWPGGAERVFGDVGHTGKGGHGHDQPVQHPAPRLIRSGWVG